MDFTLSEEQELLRSTARRLLAGECPPAVVRAHLSDRRVAGQLWTHLGEWTALADGPLVDLCLFLEETGYADAPGPFLATTVLYAPLAALAGSGSATGGPAGTVAMAGADGSWVANAEPVKTFVPDADMADQIVFVGATGSGPAVGVAVRDALELRAVETLDGSRPIFEVTVPPGIEWQPIDPVAVEGWLGRAWVGLAAEMLGTGRWLLDHSLAYAKQREQFGRPIGSFQAIQHKLANMALAQERAWAAVYYAAMTVDAGADDQLNAAHVAKATAGEAVRLCAKDAIQIHGGIGFTWEHDLHLWMRRAFASERLLGTNDWHLDRLADLVVA